MPAPRCYLDCNATMPLRQGVREAVMAALDHVGNPSSIHREGQAARRIVEGARSAVGALVGATADRVVFTSGATEAATLALSPGLRGPAAPDGPRRLLVSATEHAAVLQGHRFMVERVTVLPVRPDGTIVEDALTQALAADGGSPALVAVQAANNETGVLQPVDKIVALAHAAGGLVACDAVQVAGRLSFNAASAGVDAVLLSGHKLGGPQGAGAVALGHGVTLGPAELRGGGQERGQRAGTENVPGIAGFGAAARAALTLEADRLTGLRDRLEQGLVAIAPEAVVFGGTAERLPNTTCFAIPGATADVLLIALDLDGVAVSSGSACSSGKVSRSHVLAAMGVDAHLASGALRVSTGWASTAADIDRFLEAFAKALGHIRRRALPAAA